MSNDWLKNNKEKINIAKNTNIIKYLHFKDNLVFKQEGNSYFRDKNNKKFVCKNNVFYDNSNNKYGDSIQYLINYHNYTFKEAVEELCIFNNFNSTTIIEKENELFSFSNLKTTKNLNRTIAYLTKTRYINENIVKYLIELNLIKQTDKNNNIAFIIYDENNIPVGAELNTSLSYKRFKGLAKNSKYGYGFNIKKTKTPESILYFESAIDLISFCQYIGFEKFKQKLNTCLFCSMAGLKKNIIRNYQKIYPNSNIFLCIDNPSYEKPLLNGTKPSQNFINELEKEFNFKTITPNYKDWNEVIKLKK
jgi:hypothetical protein